MTGKDQLGLTIPLSLLGRADEVIEMDACRRFAGFSRRSEGSDDDSGRIRAQI
jgi:hypothetical protein